MLPLLRDPKKFGGKEVGLLHCEKNNSDGDVLFNLSPLTSHRADFTPAFGTLSCNKCISVYKIHPTSKSTERKWKCSKAPMGLCEYINYYGCTVAW